MRKTCGAMTAGVALGAMSLASAQIPSGLPPQGPDSPAVQRHVEVAKALAREEYAFFQNRYCNPADVEGQRSGAAQRAKMTIAPTKVFDNLYYVGLASVGAWVLQTRDGLILFDALNNAQEAERYVVGGMGRLGLDPAQIKYLVIMHGHADHYGGARYLQDKYGPRVLMSAADWSAVENMPAQRNGRQLPPPPQRDVVVTDGQKLTLGESTVVLYLTPGHSPGTISAILPLYQDGKRHTAGFWGGTGLPRTAQPLAQYEASQRRFWSIASQAGADVLISNHPYLDNTLAYLPQIQAHKAGAPNPFVIGTASYATYMGVLHECVLAAQGRMGEQGGHQ